MGPSGIASDRKDIFAGWADDSVSKFAQNSGCKRRPACWQMDELVPALVSARKAYRTLGFPYSVGQGAAYHGNLSCNAAGGRRICGICRRVRLLSNDLVHQAKGKGKVYDGC